MKTNIVLHVVDAFTATPFGGNPAAVCVLPEPRDDVWMQLIAREMNLSETAFLHPAEDGFALRWFTPVTEVKLCGHATLASAHTLWETGVIPVSQPANFLTKSGRLECQRKDDWIEMDFPARATEPIEISFALADALGVLPVFAGNSAPNWLVEVATEQELRALQPDFRQVAKLPVQGIVVTARSESEDFDFVSRYFAPATGLNEDPVTGSAHCSLGPYWRQKLGRNDFTAFQASARGGIVRTSVHDDRVMISGQAVTSSRVEMPASLSELIRS